MQRLVLAALIAALFGFACGPTPPMWGHGGKGGSPRPLCPNSELVPGETKETIQVGDVTRTYLLHVPASYDGTKPVPLVINWHALFLTGQVERNIDKYADVADREGFIIAYPDGIDNAWNIGPCCTFSRDVDDLGFAKALVGKLKRQACIDPKRVYSVGFSMGGGMSYYLACNTTHMFAAIATSGFDLAEEVGCPLRKPITEISFRSTDDPVVPYAGGETRPPNGLDTTMTFLGAEGTFEKWAELDGCRGEAVTDAHGCQTYARCRDRTEVTLCTVENGGHVPSDAEIAWETLKRHTLTGRPGHTYIPAL
jgi:polyhydroxybutyrate depolymerase